MKRIISWAIQNSPGMNVIMAAVMLIGLGCFYTMRREVFPEFCQTLLSADGVTTLNSPNDEKGEWTTQLAISHFTEHALRKLQLPPVAEASVQCLVQHFWPQQQNEPDEPNQKLSLLCAAVACLVCSAGSTMQRLAKQAQKQQQQVNSRPGSGRWIAR